MSVETAASARRGSSRSLSSAEFADRLRESWSTLWCVAAAVIGDRAEAEDAVQEASMIGLRKLDTFDPETNFGAWMGQIVRNVARNHARRRHRWSGASLDAEGGAGLEPQAPSDEAPVSMDGFDAGLVEALGELSETARTCLLLRTTCDLSYREIAMALEIPEGTAMSHAHRSRKYLRDRLARGDGQSVSEGGDCG